jgi:predicted TIM-barrel fold metal-dependent hydrolase
MNLIDTHQHLLYPDRFSYGWCAGVPALRDKPFRLEEYRAAAQGTGISQTLFMEVDVDEPQMKAETNFFLQLASQWNSGIAGVIAACRPDREDFPAFLEILLHPKLKGLRRILHTQPDEASQTPLFAANLSRLAAHHLTFDLCLLPRQLHLGSTILKRVADVQFVLDHCGIPAIKDQALDPWRERIRELSRFPNLACKISGVVAYCDPQRVNAEAIRPYIEHCLECFGWDRVVFGGDWPVCNLTSSLGRWVAIAKEIVSKESRTNQEKFFAKNAERIYRLPSPK